jgi:hypothetical protein
MSDEPRKRSGWAGSLWIVVLVLVIYPLSALPVSTVVMAIEARGFLKEDSLADLAINTALEWFYAPVEWIASKLSSR